MHDDEKRRCRDLRHACEVSCGVVSDLAVHRRHDRVRRLRTDKQRVAIGRRLRYVFGTDDAARAGAVLDEKCLVRAFGQALCEYACGEIDAASGRKRDDDANRLGRIRLRRSKRGHTHRGDERGPTEGIQHRRSSLCFDCLRNCISCERRLILTPVSIIIHSKEERSWAG